MTELLVKRLIRQSGLTQAEYARLCDVSPVFLANVVNGKKSPSKKVSGLLCFKFGLPAEQLFAPVRDGWFRQLLRPFYWLRKSIANNLF